MYLCRTAVTCTCKSRPTSFHESKNCPAGDRNTRNITGTVASCGICFGLERRIGYSPVLYEVAGPLKCNKQARQRGRENSSGLPSNTVDMRRYLNQPSREVKTEAIEKSHISRVCMCGGGEGEGGNVG